MNLKIRTKEHILNSLLTHNHSVWHVLVLHEPTARILTNLFSLSELISHNLLAIQRIEDTNRQQLQTTPSLYFVKPDSEILKTIIKDHKNKKYEKYTIYFTSKPSSDITKSLDKLENPSVTTKILNVEYECFDENIFICNFESLKTVALVTKSIFNISCVSDLTKNECIDLENIFKEEKRQRKDDLIVIDRSCDMLTPLLRFFSFQSLLNDFGYIDNNFFGEKEIYFEDELWKKIRFKHIAEINQILSKKAESINENVKKLKDAGTKDLIKLVYEAPEQIQLKEEITIFLDLLDRCITRFENENLNYVSITEQNIVTKKDSGGLKYQKGVDEFFKICNDDSVRLLDKERMFCLLTVMNYDWQKKEEDLIIKLKILEKNDLKVDKKSSLLKSLTIRRQHQITNKEIDKKYDISRYKTVLEKIIVDFINKKNLIINVTGNNDEKKEVLSLRKSEFVFQKQKKSRKVLCVYIKGGITYEEIKVVTKLSEQQGVDILLGSDEILTHTKYIENLKNGK
ncbi:hypothetical protein GVAV_001507 [Gurleya vavrai]